ncbi:DUF2599 domain-containing protein [Corynebacterium meridianum]|uniref:DUF2599 domain-containing protein n=1 Tax=Corynebacterium meridianum TaxID=2765363 RepID=A0A934IAF0_9CORY|nr:DUF2599 domain-containing protein [Corynebacterium meridianum]MBI8990288.1 DUF2599 domain-containing protein [Corynebacterium meridianum]MCK7678539.1 DUF2599 domain-containing protein [Corynebacterium meridianum]
MKPALRTLVRSGTAAGILAAGLATVAPASATPAVPDPELLGDVRDILATIDGFGGLEAVIARLNALPDSATPTDAAALVEDVDVSSYRGEPRYEITVTAAAATAPDELRDAMWEDVVDRGVPDTATLRNQFTCHYHYRDILAVKPSWNLEAARTDKGHDGFVGALCN